MRFGLNMDMAYIMSPKLDEKTLPLLQQNNYPPLLFAFYD